MRLRATFLSIATLFVALAAAQQAAQTGAGNVPQLIPYSGLAKDISGKPLSGVVGITFLLYQQEQGGSPLWLETQNVMPDKNGRYSVQLGSTSSTGLPPDMFVTGEARWLGVQPQGQAEYPRVMLLSVPYALKAGDAQTIGGLPPSAFVLATTSQSAPASTAAGTSSSSSAPPPSSPVTGTGTVNFMPLWDSTSDIISSVLFQSGSGATAKIGVNTTKPAATLDIKGSSTIRGLLNLPATGVATPTKGATSQPVDLAASAFNSGTGTAVTQTFQWQAEPVNNNTSNASGSLNLLFGQGTSKPAETGLSIASNGLIAFGTGQTFPGTGTVVSVGSGAGLTGGPITNSGSLSIATGGVTNAMLANSSLTVAPGTGLTGGGAVSLGASTAPLNVDPTQVPFLNAVNTFNGSQTVNGNLTATGAVTGSSFQIGSQLFGYGSYTFGNAYLGFAGNMTSTGGNNTAIGVVALFTNTSGSYNTAIGESALAANTTGLGNVATGAAVLAANTTGGGNTGEGDGTLKNNTTGSYNTGDGAGALISNTTGEWNTASGYEALLSNTTGNTNTALGYNSGNTTNSTNTTGSNNTFLGTYANPGTQTSLNNATAVGAFAQVTTSNSMVLGSISGVNSATASTNVGIGTTAPTATLDVHGTGNFTGLVSFASGQTFPGTGTVTSVGSGAGLTGGPITASGSLSIATGGVTNAMLANPSLTVTAGPGLTGGGPVALGGTTTLNLDTTKVPLLAASNTFTGNQTVNGNLSATGVVSSNGYQIGSNLFDYGSLATNNAFLGFAGNTAMTGANNTAAGRSALVSNSTGSFNTAVGAFTLQNNTGDSTGYYGSNNTATGYAALLFNITGVYNTASGVAALSSNTTGGSNTATGANAMYANTTGIQNTASGVDALYGNTIGTDNTASGIEALVSNTTGFGNTALGAFAGKTVDSSSMTGELNTFLGHSAAPGTGTLNNATAIGANTEVDQSNALVLGSINGVNGATADAAVGIGTTTPFNTPLAGNPPTKLNIVGNNTYVPLVVQSSSGFGTWIALSNTSSGGKPWAILSAGSGNGEGAGNLGITDFGAGGTIFLEGNVQVSGNLSKGSGSFKIDHPLDPANKFLYHSFVESPDMMNVYNGNVRTDRRGLAVVKLPDYFEALNRDFRYQLTVIGQFAQAIVAREISHNRFTIRTNLPGVKVSWQVTGIRHDAFADAHRIPNEEEKPQQERGHYLHPELFGASPEQAIGVRPLPLSQEDQVDTAQTSRETR